MNVQLLYMYSPRTLTLLSLPTGSTLYTAELEVNEATCWGVASITGPIAKTGVLQRSEPMLCSEQWTLWGRAVVQHWLAS
eukprot:COSAG02_NODE_2605_length_8442_cov_9.552080_8_plen_80_part_00